MKTIAIHTSKGGVGKTTLAVNISYELANKDKKVLVIDLDDQANCSLYLGVNKHKEFEEAKSIEKFNTILESFRDRKEIIDFLQTDIFSNQFNGDEYLYTNSHFNKMLEEQGSTGRIDVIPGSFRTRENQELNQMIGGGFNKTTRLFKALHNAGFSDKYDYIIIDTPPNLSAVSMAGLFASKFLLIPTQMEYFSVHGVSSVINYIKSGVQLETEQQRGIILGIIPMMTESRNKMNKLAREVLKTRLTSEKSEIEIFPEIKRTRYIATAAKKHLPISVFADQQKSSGSSSAAMQIDQLVHKIITKIENQ